MARGRPRLSKPGPDAYSSDLYQAFLDRLDSTDTDLADIRADRSEIIAAETQRGINRKAHAFIHSLRTAVRNDKMTQQDAVATLECVDAYAQWAGLLDQQDLFKSEADRLQRAAPPLPTGNGAAKARGAKGKGSKVTKGDATAALAAARAHLGTDEDLPPAA